MRTKDIARIMGLSTQAVRGYEMAGFLPPVERSRSGYRHFTERHLHAFQTARTLIAAGYSWQTARKMMQAVHHGNLDAALALVDERHAALHRERRKIAAAVEAIQALMVRGLEPIIRPRYRVPLRVGEAAKAVGVRPSALRFWEEQKLLQPGRDGSSRYRLYDQRQMRRLEIVVLLRGADYDFDTIRLILEELTEGKPEAAMRTVEKRRMDITQASKRCAEATTALWTYMSQEEFLHASAN